MAVSAVSILPRESRGGEQGLFEQSRKNQKIRSAKEGCVIWE